MNGRQESEEGSGHGPGEERGRAAWTPDGEGSGHGGDGLAEPPPWATAQTRTSLTPPPPLPSAWTPAPAPPPSGAPDAGAAGAAPAAPWTYGPPAGPAAAPPYQPAPPGPPSGPPPGSAPGSGPGLRRVLIALTATAVLGAGVGAGVWALTRGDGTDRADGGPATGVTVTDTPTAPGTETAPDATAPAAPATSPGTTASAPPSAAPGYRLAQDPVGYAITVPEGWRRHEKRGESAPVVTYDSPDGDRQLQIFALVEESPAASLDLAENATGYGFAHQPGYRVLTRDADGDAFSELVYRYDDEDHGARQVIDHRFRAADGTLYAIRSSAPESLDAAALREPLTAAVDSFCPAGGTCG